MAGFNFNRGLAGFGGAVKDVGHLMLRSQLDEMRSERLVEWQAKAAQGTHRANKETDPDACRAWAAGLSCAELDAVIRAADRKAGIQPKALSALEAAWWAFECRHRQ